MTSDDMIVWLHAEAHECRGLLARPDLTVQEARDLVEMHLLLFPSVLRVLDLTPAEGFELTQLRTAFRIELRERQAVMTGADFAE